MGRVIVGARCICQNQRWDFVEKVEKFLDVKIDLFLSWRRCR